MRPDALEAGGLALSAVSERGKHPATGKRLGREPGLRNLFPMREAVTRREVALSRLHGGPASGEPGTEAAEERGGTCRSRSRPGLSS